MTNPLQTRAGWTTFSSFGGLFVSLSGSIRASIPLVFDVQMTLLDFGRANLLVSQACTILGGRTSW